MKIPPPDLRQAQLFLKTLCGDSLVTLQTFMDKKDVKTPGTIKIIHTDSQLTGYEEQLDELQQKGAGVYVMVNEGDGEGRCAANVIGVRALFADLDGVIPDSAIDYKLKPQIVVKSSPGKYHCYWLVDDSFPKDKFKEYQQKIIKKFNADKAVHDLPRVMRVPGYIHMKGEPHRSMIIRCEEDNRYNRNDIETNFKSGNLNLDLTDVIDVDNPAEGNRNVTLCRLVGQWLRDGLNKKEIAQKADEWNNNLSNPLKKNEVNYSVNSIIKTHKNNPKNGIVDDSEIKEPREIEIEYPEDEFPDHLLHPGGLVEEITKYIGLNSPASHKSFNLASTLTLIGALAGQRFMSGSELRTNLYCLALGYSGSGKDAPLSTIPVLLRKAGINGLLGASTFTSASAMLKEVENNHIKFFLMDEIGDVINNLKSKNSFGSEIPKVLKELFTSADRHYTKTFSTQKCIDINWHHVSWYGVSTPENFWKSLTFGDITDGFIARCLIFESGHDAERPDFTKKRPGWPEDLVCRIKNLHVGSRNHKPEDESKIWPVPNPHEVPFTTEAEAIMTKFSEHFHNLKNYHKRNEDGRAAVYGRATEHAIKISLIVQIGKDEDNTNFVDVESTRYATNLVDFIVKNMIRNMESNISTNPMEALCQKVYNLIKRKVAKDKKKYVELKDVYQGVRGLDARSARNVLQTLIQSEKIICEMRDNISGRGQKENYTLYELKKE